MRLWREADSSSPSSAMVKNGGPIPSLPPYVFIAWCLIKHGEKFTFVFFAFIFEAFVIKRILQTTPCFHQLALKCSRKVKCSGVKNASVVRA
jgi:hypothetical protein